ncbi:hypothetical protein HNP38_001593 [Chryseobacterium defluvii]|uniref:Uncharacterized protein n=1 Tax=Chryseobacterium defluvii TaxID=160396 RepID=A0A840KA57_9FLAO|nr:hypothetical protein [Chryseobacterium defluvii]MBB4806321.1 hypothetical protein [Chryseobacterium defluvii]
MIYTIEKANLISEQLRKFKDAFNYQLAGHYGNINFWMNEVKESIIAIDNYNKRFKALSDCQKEWISNHNEPVHEYCHICGGKCEFSNGIPSPPRKIESSLLKETRKNLTDSAYYFLIRIYNSGMIDYTSLENLCNEIDLSIEPKDLKIKNKP